MAKPKRPPNIDELIARMKRDAAAYNVLLTYAYAYLRWKSGYEKASASRGKSDLGQEAIERVLRGLANFEGTTGDKFDAWLSKIFATRVAEVHRHETRDRRNVQLAVPIHDIDPDTIQDSHNRPSQTASDNEAVVDLWAAIFKLPPDQKRAVLTLLDGRSLAQAAAEMQKSEAAVGALWRRGLETIHARFDASMNDREGSVTPAMRKKWTLALLRYSKVRDSGQSVDIDSFIDKYAPTDELLRSLLIWLERIRESGDEKGGGGRKR